MKLHRKNQRTGEAPVIATGNAHSLHDSLHHGAFFRLQFDKNKLGEFSVTIPFTQFEEMVEKYRAAYPDSLIFKSHEHH